MHLREIELENFKSFAHKTRIPLLPGYTAITGPNGAGKSNISDAILFVLGPRSSRVIRAGRLTDLLYNGGKASRPATECRVSLYIDNSDGLIPIEADTVKLTRLVRLSDTADGYYSYYYLNDKKSSLSEIESLLAHARISADGYNFVQQGDITKIVEMGNIERRRILDDIAGIRKFDDDISRAERERQEADENIARLNIIVDEIRKQMRQLEADRECALKYRELRDRLHLAKAQLAAKKKDEAEAELAGVQRQIAQYEEDQVRLQQEIESAKEEIEGVGAQLVKVDDRIVEKGGESAREIKEKIDQIRIDLARAEDAVATSEEQIQLMADEGKELKSEFDEVERQLAELAERRDGLSVEMDEKRSELERLTSSLSEEQEAISESDSKLRKLHEELGLQAKNLTEKEDLFRMQSIDQDKLEGRIDRLRKEIAELEETRRTYEFELKDSEWSEKQLRDERKSSEGEARKLQEEFHAKRAEEKRLAKEAQELEDAIKRLTREYNKLKAEADAARMVAEGYTAAVGGILEARDKGQIKGVHGTVSELCRVDPKYETALTVAAGNRLQAIIVDDDAVAAKCIETLKKNKLGRATFLPLNKLVMGKARGKAILAAKKSLGYAIDLVEFDERYRAALWYVLGDTVVVSDLDRARAMMGGVRMVTLGGELIEATGAMVGGSLSAKGARFGTASESQIEKVATDLRTATEQAERTNARLWEVREEISRIEDGLKSTSMSDSGQDAKLSSIEVKKREFAQKIASIRQELDSKGKELSEALDAKDDLEKQLTRLESEILELKKRRDALSDKIQRATPRELAERLKRLETGMMQANTDIAALNSQLEIAKKQMELIEARKEEIEEAQGSCAERREEHERRIEESKGRLQALETELAALRKMEQSMGAELEKLRSERDELYRRRTELEAKIDKCQSKIETTHDLVIGLRTKQGAAEGALSELIEELKRYSLEFPPDTGLPPVSELKATIQSCESELNSLGVVNLRAIEDYDEKKNRYDSLRSEISQLKKQKTNLIKLLEELNDKKKLGLLKVYEAIRENFARIYADLSGGGEAELIIENPDDPLSGGLIIRARPRNRKTLRLEALSGGEKSLTALSFIFAIQQYQPSPFYLLDEVDMFLDGVNAENIARVISKNAANAQFIQVSLRKVTLKEADHILGVTLQPSGMSQVIMRPNIGLDLPESDEREAAEEAG